MSKLFIDFVASCFGGNQTAAAAALGVDKSTVSRICTGDRGVTPPVALRAEQLADELLAGGAIDAEAAARFRKEAFIWPDAVGEEA